MWIALAACGSAADDVGSGALATSAEGSTISTTSTDGGTGFARASGDDESTGEPPNSFIEHPDGGSSVECDIWAQDCPQGQKCAPWADDGGHAWNGTKCVEIVSDPAGAGESCTVDGTVASGVDTCDIGALCFNVNPQTLTGVCRELCMGSEDNPTCADPELTCGGSRNLPLCLPSCCPLEQDCLQGEGCYGVGDDFRCVIDASGEDGAFADPCDFINECSPGLLCLGAASVPQCVGSVGCCTHFCTVESAQCADLDPWMDCMPWYEQGHAPLGLEHIGVCALPP